MQVAEVTVAAGIAFAGSLVLTPLARNLAWKIGAVCKPDGKRKLHARPTPLGGGGAVYLASLLSIAACCLLATDAVEDKLPVALGLSAGILCLLGFYDDLYDMPARWKLVGQIVSTLPVLVAGSYVRQFTLFGHSMDVGLLGVPATIAWLVLGVNALNLLDGMDGLASMIGIVISVAVGAIAATQNRPEVMLLAFVLAGALAGFLVHNLPPARIYLGDCGSMVIGFTLALLALRVSLAPLSPTTCRVTVAAALLFVPLTDTALAIARRTMKGCSFMVADRGHIHHQLLNRGLGNWGVLGVMGGFSVATAMTGWWVSVSGSDLLGWGALASIALFLAGGRLLAVEEWSLARGILGRSARMWTRRLSPANLGSRVLLPGDRKEEDLPNTLPHPAVLQIDTSASESETEPQEHKKAA